MTTYTTAQMTLMLWCQLPMALQAERKLRSQKLSWNMHLTLKLHQLHNISSAMYVLCGNSVCHYVKV